MAEAQPEEEQTTTEEENWHNPRRWYDGYSSKFAREAFCPGVHCTFAELEYDRKKNKLPKRALRAKKPKTTDNNKTKSFRYTCMTDVEYLKGQSKTSTTVPNYKFPVTDLRHVTDKKNVEPICTHGFKGARNTNPLRCVAVDSYNQEYVWWSVYFKQGSVHRETAQTTVDQIEKRAETSYPFQDKNFSYGNRAFCYPWSEVISAYKKQFCHDLDSKLCFRVLGTFVYRQEIMHAIVVHCADTNSLFNNLPLIMNGVKGNRVEVVMNWCPESVIMINEPPFSPWENLSFAFHVPKGRFFTLDSLEKHHESIKCQQTLKNQATHPTAQKQAETKAKTPIQGGTKRKTPKQAETEEKTPIPGGTNKKAPKQAETKEKTSTPRGTKSKSASTDVQALSDKLSSLTVKDKR